MLPLKYALPPTESVCSGEVVPIPTRSFALSTYNVEPSTCRAEENRLVEEAVVEKRLVVVALVVVELPVIIKLESIVEEAVERKPCKKPRVVEVELP